MVKDCAYRFPFCCGLSSTWDLVPPRTDNCPGFRDLIFFFTKENGMVAYIVRRVSNVLWAVKLTSSALLVNQDHEQISNCQDMEARRRRQRRSARWRQISRSIWRACRRLRKAESCMLRGTVCCV